MSEKGKQKLLNMQIHPPKNHPAGPQLRACPLCGSHWDLHWPHAGVPVLAPSGVFLVLSTQLWGAHRSGTIAVLWPVPGSEGLWPHNVEGKLSSLMHHCFLREPVGLRSCNSFKRFKSVAFMKCYSHRLYSLGILLICSVTSTHHIADYFWPIGI